MYFCAFWLIWIGAVFALFGNWIAGIFNFFLLTSPTETVILFSKYVLSGWAIVQLWKVTRRSPFVFQEEDAYLLCQTPLDRRTVGLAWFLQGWIGSILPFVAGTVILAFALVEWQWPGEVTISELTAYIQASMRALSIVIPLHAAILAGVWSLGAWRLRWKHEPVSLHFFAPGLSLIWLATLFKPEQFAWLLMPLDFSLYTAFGGDGLLHNWWIGFGSVLLFLGIGLAMLAWSTTRINLSRAAQETSMQAKLQLARSQWQFGLVDTWGLRQRLGMARAPSYPPTRSGAWVLVWKDALQSWRSFQLHQMVRWLWLFVLNLGAFLVPNIFLRLVFWGLWAVSLGELTTHRFRNDLAHWWVLRSLPFHNRDLLLTEIVLSGGAGILLGWMALLVSRPPLILGLTWGILLPFLVANIAFGTMQDILRRSKIRELLSPSIAEENVPQQNLLGILPGLISVITLAGLLMLRSTHIALPFLDLIILALAWVFTVRNMKTVLSAYQWLE
jgi:hypothetical protein